MDSRLKLHSVDDVMPAEITCTRMIIHFLPRKAFHAIKTHFCVRVSFNCGVANRGINVGVCEGCQSHGCRAELHCIRSNASRCKLTNMCSDSMTEKWIQVCKWSETQTVHITDLDCFGFWKKLPLANKFEHKAKKTHRPRNFPHFLMSLMHSEGSATSSSNQTIVIYIFAKMSKLYGNWGAWCMVFCIRCNISEWRTNIVGSDIFL